MSLCYTVHGVASAEYDISARINNAMAYYAMVVITGTKSLVSCHSAKSVQSI